MSAPTPLEWACCRSSIGPECGHKIGGIELNRRRAASEPKGDSIARNQEIQAARNAAICAGCGHESVSHGYPEADYDGSIGGFFQKWPDGSHIGMGACGVDRDTRNHATGWIGDPCPCVAFRHASEGESA